MKDNMGNLRCYDSEIVKVWYSKQQLCTCIPLFGTFLSVAANCDLKFPNSRFCKGFELTTTLFSNCLSLNSVLKKPPCILQIVRVGIIEMILERKWLWVISLPRITKTKESLWLLPLTACSLPFLMFSLKTRLNLISARLQTTTIRDLSQSTAYYLYKNFRK